MQRYVPALMLLGSVACGRPSAVLEHPVADDTRVIVHGRMPVRHGAVAVRQEGRLTHAQVELLNDSTRDVSIEYRWEWTDSEGFQLGDTLASWQPAVVAGHARLLLNNAGPGPRASTFRLYIRAAEH
jgi:uncharacterized protein YcfL